MNISERARIRQRRKLKADGFGELHDALTEILFRHNPAALPRTPGGRDDYGAPVGTLIPHLEAASSADDVRALLLVEMNRWYGKSLPPDTAYAKVSRDIWDAWRSFTSTSKA